MRISYSLFEFTNDKVIIYDTNKEQTEILNYQDGTVLTDAYSMILDLVDFKRILDGCTEQYVTLNFGDNKACVLVRTAIKNVIPEINSAAFRN